MIKVFCVNINIRIQIQIIQITNIDQHVNWVDFLKRDVIVLCFQTIVQKHKADGWERNYIYYGNESGYCFWIGLKYICFKQVSHYYLSVWNSFSTANIIYKPVGLFKWFLLLIFENQKTQHIWIPSTMAASGRLPAPCV